MIFCRVVMGIKWECLCKMVTTYWPTNMSFLLHACVFLQLPCIFILVLFASLKK